MFFTRSTAIAALAALPVAFAQTFTDCNPTEKVCPSDPGLATANFVADFTQGSSAGSSFTPADYTTINYGPKGAEYTINKAGEAPTVSSDFYIFFGRVEVKMQAAPGTGIVSSIVLESDDLDEIDWEFLGGDTTQVETNFFGKGNTTTYNRAIYYPVSQPQSGVHTYTVDWTPESLSFEIDGTTVRTIQYDEALTVYGKNYPQTPMRLKLGNWAGGAPGEPEGTVEWAGGATDFSKAPFTMYVESVSITNYKPAAYYTYGDETGDWQSIKLSSSSSSGGNSSSSSSSSASSSASASASSSASGSSSTLASSSASVTSAPTSSLAAGSIAQSGVVVSSTVTGNATYAASTGFVSSTGTFSGTPTPTSTLTHAGAASANQVAFSGSLMGLVLGAFMLL